MVRICNQARSTRCPDPMNCCMAKPHECAHPPGSCLLRSGREMHVRCIEIVSAARNTKTARRKSR